MELFLPSTLSFYLGPFLSSLSQDMAELHSITWKWVEKSFFPSQLFPPLETEGLESEAPWSPRPSPPSSLHRPDLLANSLRRWTRLSSSSLRAALSIGLFRLFSFLLFSSFSPPQGDWTSIPLFPSGLSEHQVLQLLFDLSVLRFCVGSNGRKKEPEVEEVMRKVRREEGEGEGEGDWEKMWERVTLALDDVDWVLQEQPLRQAVEVSNLREL